MKQPNSPLSGENKSDETGATGWILLWLIGIPIPILLIFFLLRGCT
ncbi:MAG TPA: hypothetical protein VIW21_02505 [Chthoniobacterales bacterium]|jgi:hypothetical protein